VPEPRRSQHSLRRIQPWEIREKLVHDLDHKARNVPGYRLYLQPAKSNWQYPCAPECCELVPEHIFGVDAFDEAVFSRLNR